ncbi:Ferrochelatase [Chlamydiales bacterium STE3]|nr:Ferrochelatase [Chlamydiales bacterium STE3]
MTTAILLVNLGTPKSPQPKDVYRYLIEFLNDERVIDTPWLIRQFLVRGVIVPLRYRTSAKSYQAIWTDQGSPLMVHSTKLQRDLQSHLGEKYSVGLAMRYQTPSIEETLSHLLKKTPEHLIIAPLFPQYASATTGSVHQRVMEILKKERVFPRLTFLNHFANHPSLINAYKEIAAPYPHEEYDHVLYSFHGLPKRQLIQSNCHQTCLANSVCCEQNQPQNSHCYSAQCYRMAKQLNEALAVPHGKFSVSFQSRLGRDPWLEPYTNETLLKLAKSGKKRVLVFCPSFVCDCLETIFEIAQEYNEEFMRAGGEKLQLIPGLNAHPAWVKALAEIVTNP